MTVECITCKHWSPKTTDAKMVRLGFARCTQRSRDAGHTFSATYARECDRHTAADAQIVKARREYDARVQ